MSPPTGIEAELKDLAAKIDRQEFVLMGLSAIVTDLLVQVQVLEATKDKE